MKGDTPERILAEENEILSQLLANEWGEDIAGVMRRVAEFRDRGESRRGRSMSDEQTWGDMLRTLEAWGEVTVFGNAEGVKCTVVAHKPRDRGMSAICLWGLTPNAAIRSAYMTLETDGDVR